MKGRIRNHKPELGKHYLLWRCGQLTGWPIAYWYALLWNWTDRRGRFVWDAQRLKVEIAPFDSLNFEQALNAMANAGFIVKYRAGARLYGWIPRFANHQQFNGREDDSVLPPPPSSAQAHAESRDLYANQRGFESREELVQEPATLSDSDQAADSPISSSDIDLGSREDRVGHMHTIPSHPIPSHPVEKREGGETRLPAIRGKKDVVAIRDRMATVFAEVSQQSEARMSADDMRKLQAEMIFLYWAARFKHQGALLDRKREGKIIERLKENSGDVSELLYALDGAAHDPWIIGTDPKSNGKKYDDIPTIFRDRSQIERFAETRRGYREKAPHKLLAQLEQAARGNGEVHPGE